MEKLTEWLITGLIAFLASFSLYQIGNKRKYKKEMYDKIEEIHSKKADRDYVDKKVEEVRHEIKNSNDSGQKQFDMLVCFIQSMDKKIDILLENKNRK